MRKWAVWCINHRMKFVVQATLIAGLPVYMVAGVVAGCAELLKEWRSDWRSIRKASSQEGK